MLTPPFTQDELLDRYNAEELRENRQAFTRMLIARTKVRVDLLGTGQWPERIEEIPEDIEWMSAYYAIDIIMTWYAYTMRFHRVNATLLPHDILPQLSNTDLQKGTAAETDAIKRFVALGHALPKRTSAQRRLFAWSVALQVELAYAATDAADRVPGRGPEDLLLATKMFFLPPPTIQQEISDKGQAEFQKKVLVRAVELVNVMVHGGDTELAAASQPVAAIAFAATFDGMLRRAVPFLPPPR